MENLPNEKDLIFNSFPPKKSLTRILFYFIFGGIIFIFVFFWLFLSAPKNFPQQAIITIEPGESLRSLSENLKEKKIIRSRVALESFIIIYGGEKHIAPGDYLFEDKIPVFEIARRIVVKDRHLAPVKITIPEGFDVQQITEVASIKLKNFNSEKFLATAQDQEGYLFPDTYFFFTTDNEADVLRYLSENFDKKIKSILPEIEISGRTQKEIIIMASIIEREAKGNNDRAIIAGILWNRIQKNMPLQVDAVPETYKKKGLPLKPICNPGLLAIKAAIKPTNSPYLYYLHDENGGIHYAKTFTEHKQNKLKYLK